MQGAPSAILAEAMLVTPSSQVVFDAKRVEVLWADDGAALVKRGVVNGDVVSYSIAVTGKCKTIDKYLHCCKI